VKKITLVALALASLFLAGCSFGKYDAIGGGHGGTIYAYSTTDFTLDASLAATSFASFESVYLNNIQFDDISALTITLVSPTGTVKTLVSTDVYRNFFGTYEVYGGPDRGTYVIIDNATYGTSYDYYDMVSGQTFQSYDSLVSLANENPNGTWTLRIANNSSRTGALGSFEFRVYDN
jgi:subtilisin-like proprotein convertase family protein